MSPECHLVSLSLGLELPYLCLGAPVPSVTLLCVPGNNPEEHPSPSQPCPDCGPTGPISPAPSLCLALRGQGRPRLVTGVSRGQGADGRTNALKPQARDQTGQPPDRAPVNQPSKRPSSKRPRTRQFPQTPNTAIPSSLLPLGVSRAPRTPWEPRHRALTGFSPQSGPFLRPSFGSGSL